jgi:hypothetical protein
MKYLYQFLICLSVILCQCGSSLVLNKKWERTDALGKSLAIVFPEKNISIQYAAGDVKNEFGEGDKISSIKKAVLPLLRNQMLINTAFQNIWFDDLAKTISCKSRSIHCERGQISLTEPIERCNVVLENHQSDFVLIIDHFYISASLSTMSYCMNLTVSMSFILWDVNQKQLVSYGYVKNSGAGFHFIDINSWKSAFTRDVIEMFEGTGLIPASYETQININQHAMDLQCYRDKIALKGKKIRFLAANTITKNDIDSGDIKNILKKKIKFKTRPFPFEDNFYFMPSSVPGTCVDSASSFNRLYTSLVGNEMSTLYPNTVAEKPVESFQEQVLNHFAEFDYPIDTLNSATINWAREDSLDYLIVFYSRFTQPKPDDDVEKLDNYDINYYCNIIDVKNNISFTDCYLDYDDINQFSTDESLMTVTKTFIKIALIKLKARFSF